MTYFFHFLPSILFELKTYSMLVNPKNIFLFILNYSNFLTCGFCPKCRMLTAYANEFICSWDLDF